VTQGSGPGNSPSQMRPALSRSRTWERLRIYLIGVGIGCMLLGMFAMLKWQAKQAQAGQAGGQQQSQQRP